MKKIVEYKLISISVVIFLCGFLYLVYTLTQKESNEEKYTVSRENLEQVVSLTGTVKPTEEAKLSFEKTGVVKQIYVTVGESVKEGDILASLFGSDEEAKVLEAQANLASAIASLENSQTGSKEETIAIKQAGVEKAKNDLIQVNKNASDAVKNLSITGNSAVRDSFAKYFSGSISQSYQVNIGSCDTQMEFKLSNLRLQSELALIEIEKSGSAKSEIENVKTNLVPQITEYLTVLKNIFSLSCLTGNTNFDTDRANITTLRNTWSSQTNDLSIKLNAIYSGEVAVVQAEKDLQLVKSGEKSQLIKQAEAQVSAARARLSAAQVVYNKNILKAPFTGIITNIDLKKGEYVSQNDKGISIISDTNFQIESKVSEVDVAKLSVGSNAEVTFDAYGDDNKFQAVISNISLAGIISEGVPTFKTIFDFLNKDERVRSGMTANIFVTTNVLENVVSVPAKFIQNEKGEKYVTVVNGNFTEKRKIKTGVLGKNGKVEIVKGVDEGEVIEIEK